MPYCPNCLAEYSVGFTRCAQCGDSLPVLPFTKKPSIEEDTQKLVLLATFPSVVEAEMIKELLETNGIETMIRGETDPIGTKSGAAPSQLLVLEQDFERAQALYQAFFAGKPEGNFTEFDE
jgi:Putative prokaryotic signal transducing protein